MGGLRGREGGSVKEGAEEGGEEGRGMKEEAL